MGVAVGMLRKRDGGPEQDSPLSDTDRAAAWACFLAAELPDVDVFFGGGPMGSLQFHRGWTHSLPAAPLIALAATGLVKLVWREARLRTVYSWSLISLLLAHLVNDWATGWGTRLLLPFTQVRYGLDYVPIVDLLYTVPLIATVIYAWRRPAARRKAAAALLTYLGLYTFAYRGVSHFLVDRAVAQAYAGKPVTKIQVSPNMFNPVAWQFVVDLGDRYDAGSAVPFGPVVADRTEAIAPDDPVTKAVRTAPELKPFFDQFRYPVIRYEKVADGYAVTLADIRYQLRGRGITYQALLNADLQVTRIVDGGF